jgi:biopolymer transport protein ExbB
MYEIYHFLFVKGGPVMYPIIIGSIAALALFLERAWVLRQERTVPRGFGARMRTLIKGGKLFEGTILCQENGSALANIIHAGLKESGKPGAEVKDSITDAGRREVARLEERVDLLGTIAAIEPLMGLLGTVTGLIRAFQQVESMASKGTGVNAGALAAGIWEALITTAAGLIVGIPAYLGFRYLQGRINGLAVELEEDAMEVGKLIADGAGAAAPSDQGATAGEEDSP